MFTLISRSGEALEIFFNGPADKASVNCRSSLQDLEEIFDIFLTSSNSVPQEDEISLELASVTAAPQWKQEERIGWFITMPHTVT
jgi:hypothetical protein